MADHHKTYGQALEPARAARQAAIDAADKAREDAHARAEQEYQQAKTAVDAEYFPKPADHHHH